MKKIAGQFSDIGLMHLHQIFFISILKKTYKPEQKDIVTAKERMLYDELVNRVPVAHLWEIEKMQRDLNLKIE